MFLGKGVLKIYRKFTGEHPCRSAILIKLLYNFIEITLRHGCSPVNLLLIFRISYRKNTSGWLCLALAKNKLIWKNSDRFVPPRKEKVTRKGLSLTEFKLSKSSKCDLVCEKRSCQILAKFWENTIKKSYLFF